MPAESVGPDESRVPTGPAAAGTADTRAGPGGGRTGSAGGDLGGTLGAVGRGAPVVSPRPGVSRPLAVRCRGGWPGGLGGGTSGRGSVPRRPGCSSIYG